MVEIPGIKAIHCVISDACRQNRTEAGAAMEAWNRLYSELHELFRIHEVGKDVKFHLVLSVEIPKSDS